MSSAWVHHCYSNIPRHFIHNNNVGLCADLHFMMRERYLPQVLHLLVQFKLNHLLLSQYCSFPREGESMFAPFYHESGGVPRTVIVSIQSVTSMWYVDYCHRMIKLSTNSQMAYSSLSLFKNLG